MSGLLDEARSWAARGERGCAVALGASIPVSVALDNLLMVLFIACWLAAGGFAERIRRIAANPVALAALAFAAVMVAGMAWSDAPAAKLKAGGVDALRFVLLAAFAVTFLDPRTRRLGENAFLWAMGVTAALSYLLWTGWVDAIPGVKGKPIYPVVFKYHITHNLLMALAALLLAIRAMAASTGRGRALYAAGAALAAANVLLLVPGRTGQLALLAGIVYLVLARLRWKGVLAGTVLLGVLGSAAWFAPDSVLRERFALGLREAQAWEPGVAQSQFSSIGLRLEFWRNSLDLVAARPLLGAGTGAFRDVYAQQVSGSEMVATEHPHNAFLYVTVELGALGLAVLLALLVAQWLRAGRMPALPDRAAARSLVVVYVLAGAVTSTFGDHAEGLFYAWASGMLFAAVGPARRSGA